MFGIASFAQTPFASLAGVSFSFSLTEDLAADDASTQLSAFLFSHNEAITENEIEVTGVGLFFGSLNETLTADDSSTQLSTFPQDITENFNPADAQAIEAQFSVSLSEDAALADNLVPFFAALQSREEDILEVADASTQQSAFLQSRTENLNSADARTVVAGFNVAISENTVLADSSAVSGWLKIITTQNANWTNLTDSQTPGWAGTDTSQNPNWQNLNVE